jgi:acyl carrier protein
LSNEEILSGLKDILKTIKTIDQSKVETITENTDFFLDLGVPSTDLVNIVAKAEDKFDVEFDDDDVDDLGSTIKDTIQLIIKSQVNS